MLAGQAAHVAAECARATTNIVGHAQLASTRAGAHCHAGAMYLLHQTIFNYRRQDRRADQSVSDGR